MKSKKLLNIFLYLILTLFMLFSMTLIFRELRIDNFINDIEAKSFDLRQIILKNNSFDGSKIALITIDDDSLDKLASKYGTWPWHRGAYADLIRYLEKEKADSVIFDLMFMGYQNGNFDKDKDLINEITKNNNVYISMNFDYRDNENPQQLPLELIANLDNKSSVDYKDFTFTNVRSTIPEILHGTDKIGFINFMRDNDGIARRAPTFFIYKENYYPYISIKVVQEYMLRHNLINSKKFVITPDRHLIMGDRKIPLDHEGLMILNWYAKQDIKEIPFWKIIENNNYKYLPKGYFNDKIVYIGASAVSLYDTKSTPFYKHYPGVKIHTTVLKNIFDNIVIKRAEPEINIAVTIALIVLTWILLFRITSNMINALTVFGIVAVYFAFSLFLLSKFYIWIDVVYPIFLVLITYTIAYVIKFVNKSRDFEQTYKLATTDGLTELYNHRYFQEQMQANIANSKRYNSNFSLILIDIDFFKKFNDTYGHQSGDAVLKQVAQLLKKMVRSTDIVARYGGEEMAIILTNTNYDEALIAAGKICEAVAARPFRLMNDIEKNVTISLGVASYPQHGETPGEMISYADKCLYAAKEKGRNQVGKI
ncbi:MAG: diguanylate cyclase [Candidatus Gastranaerophilales bacterium]|nr:diguanylate cyclase [Candidatus Gastranaerophilales bacterium]